MGKFTYENIPQELRSLKQWGLFQLKWVKERNKNTKIPIDPYNGRAGKSNDPSTWSDFNTALKALDEIERADGLAFYFTNGYVGLDIDHISDDLADWHQGDSSVSNLINKFRLMTDETYMEVSQSGTGIHCIFKGEIPGNRRRKGNYEMYQQGRFFALTGNSIGIPKIVTLSKEKMQALYNFLFGADKSVPDKIEEPEITALDLSIPDIIQRAEKSKTGTRFTMFMKGGWEQFYNSHSEADMAFANDLAFWTGRDFHKMDTIFRNSSLMRDKYDEKRGATTYGISLLNKAISEAVNIYNPEQDGKEPDLVFNWNKPKKRAVARSWDDTGRGLRLNDQFGDVFRYMAADKTWYFYNGSYWELDNGRHIELAAEKVVNLIKTENPDFSFATQQDKDKAMKEWNKFIKESRSHMAKIHMIEEFKKYVTIDHGVFDHDNMLLNTESGYVDLTNGELKDHDIKKMFSEQTASEYSDNIDCPMWKDFLEQIFNHDEKLIHYIQKAIGYSFTGSTKEQVMFIPYGNGRNGKSVLLDTIQDVAGGYAKTMNVSSIMTKYNSNGANSDIARLEGSRMVISSEANEGQRLDEGLVKQLTGGDRIVARQQYGKEFEYQPSYKIWMATNHKPLIRGTDEGIWRRLILIPFDYQVPKDKIDRNLKYKLEAESMGILNWIVEGAIMWQVEGLQIPERIKNASQKYREEMDVLSGFVNDCCELGPGFTAKSGELYESYKNWAADANEYKMNLTRFGKEMSKKFHRKVSHGYKVYEGIRIKQDTRFEWNG